VFSDWSKIKMVLDTGTLIAIVIALAGSLTMMCLFWKQNIEQHKEIRRLQIALRATRTNSQKS
jgi:hypothetical protein